mmetsp:Transcript_56254/g.100191  ORF Transcript_56254/g.100191 Transcript_56254/m.100191 type:complete len:537 (-) Transcript_56254:163-1773(-)
MNLFVSLLSSICGAFALGAIYTPYIYTAGSLEPHLPGWINVESQLPPCSFVAWDLGEDCKIQCLLKVKMVSSHTLYLQGLTSGTFETFRTWVTGLPIRQQSSSMDAGGCRNGPIPTINHSVWETNVQVYDKAFTIQLQEHMYMVAYNPSMRVVRVPIYNITGTPLTIKPMVYDTHDTVRVFDLSTGAGFWQSATIGGVYQGVDFVHDLYQFKGDLLLEYRLNVEYSGMYRVAFANAYGFGDECTDAWYQIAHDGGTTDVIHNQRTTPGVYIDVGDFYFSKGTGTIRLRNDASNGRMTADAIRLTYVRPDDPVSCLSEPCMNAGTCIEKVGTFSCSCPTSHGGDRCQYAIPATAQYLENYWQPVEDALFLGNSITSGRIQDVPIAYRDQDFLLYASGTSEANTKPIAGATVYIQASDAGTPSQVPLVWTAAQSLGGNWMPGDHDNFMQYCALAIYTPVQLEDFHVGLKFDASIRVWVDKVQVYLSDSAQVNGVASASITLGVGWHQVLIKMWDGTGTNSMYFWFDKPVWWSYQIPTY